MNYKSGQKYFTQKEHYPLLITAIAFIIICIFSILYSWMVYIGVILLIISLIIIAIYESSHISNKEFDQIVDKEFEIFEKSFVEKHIISQYAHKHVIDKSICEENTRYNFAFDFERENVLVHKGSDGKYRCSLCQMNALIVSDKYLITEIVNFSVIEPWQTEKSFKIKYCDLLPVQLTEFEEFSVSYNKYKKLKIESTDHSIELELFVPNDADGQKYIGRINKKIYL